MTGTLSVVVVVVVLVVVTVEAQEDSVQITRQR